MCNFFTWSAAKTGGRTLARPIWRTRRLPQTWIKGEVIKGRDSRAAWGHELRRGHGQQHPNNNSTNRPWSHVYQSPLEHHRYQSRMFVELLLGDRWRHSVETANQRRRCYWWCWRRLCLPVLGTWTSSTCCWCCCSWWAPPSRPITKSKPLQVIFFLVETVTPPIYLH